MLSEILSTDVANYFFMADGQLFRLDAPIKGLPPLAPLDTFPDAKFGPNTSFESPEGGSKSSYLSLSGLVLTTLWSAKMASGAAGYCMRRNSNGQNASAQFCNGRLSPHLPEWAVLTRKLILRRERLRISTWWKSFFMGAGGRVSLKQNAPIVIVKNVVGTSRTSTTNPLAIGRGLRKLGLCPAREGLAHRDIQNCPGHLRNSDRRD